MTPQILLDALRKAFLSLETVCLMIVDECHRATGNHPYTKIMKVNIDHGWKISFYAILVLFHLPFLFFFLLKFFKGLYMYMYLYIYVYIYIYIYNL